MGELSGFKDGGPAEPMNDNGSPSPSTTIAAGSTTQLPSSHSSSVRATPTIPPLPPPTTLNSLVGTPQSINSGISGAHSVHSSGGVPGGGSGSITGLIVSGGSGGSTLLRGQPSIIPSPCPPPQSLLSQPHHYFRPIIPHHQQHLHHHHHHRTYSSGRSGHDDFDLTSDSDASSSIIGPPPPLLTGLGGRPGSPPHHHLAPRLPILYNGNPPPIPSNPPGTAGGGVWMHGIFSPTGQSAGSGPLRFDESSFLGTSDACSSPETGSLPRSSKLTKRKRPPRPPPRRLKSEDYTLPEEDDRNMGRGGEDEDDDEDDDPHLRHLIARSWPRDTPSPVPSSGYHQQQLQHVMTMSMGARLDELQVHDEKSMDTAMALSEIRTQLQELTKSVESCQTEVGEVKRDIHSMRSDIDMVHHVKDDLEDLRECVDRLDEQTRDHRKKRLLEQGLTLFLSFSIFAAILGMFNFGYNTGVINAPKQEIIQFMKGLHQNEEEIDVQFLYSIIVSIFIVGGMLGGFSGGIIANRFGRKGGLLLNNVLGIVGGCLMWLTVTTQSYILLIVGRFIIGVHCGVNTHLVPMYVSEIAPLNLRGALGTVNQLAVTIGLLISQILGINQLLGSSTGWPTLLGLAVVPAVLQMLLLPMCPESPRYLLITRQREDEARRALRKIRATNHVEEDVEEMRAEIRAQQSEASISMLQLLRSSTLRMPLCIAIVMQLSQQLSGITAVFYYSTDFFQQAGLELDQAKFATIGVGAIMTGMTLVSIMLMDRAGRRSLHLYGLGGMFVFSLFITIAMLIKEILDWISYLAVIFTLSFVVFFAVGPGSIPWMITAELFSQGPRAAAMAMANLVNWCANLVVSLSFPWMQTHMSSYVFLPFSVLLAIFWTFTYNKVPETKNKTFEEIAALFKRNANRVPSEETHIYGMSNCVNSLGQPIRGPENAALIEDRDRDRIDSISKLPPDSSVSGRSSRLGLEMSPPANVPPPPVPFSIPPYPQRYLDDNAV